MASAAQIAANRANAQHSTGPRTPEGKRRVSRNAVTHRLDCRDVVLPGEDAGAFATYHLAMVADHAPCGAEEQDCVERMVAAQWRLRRLWRAEGEILSQANQRLGFDADFGTGVLFDAQHEKGLAYLDRKEAALSREYHRSSRRLQELQDQRRKGTRHAAEDTPGETDATHSADGQSENPAELSQFETTAGGKAASPAVDIVIPEIPEQSQFADVEREAA